MDSINITGAKILFEIPIFGGIPITETQVNSWIVMAVIAALCIFLTRGLKVRATSKRQVVAEWIVETVEKLVRSNMGERFMGFSPFIAAILVLSAFSSLLALFGVFAPTSDINVVAGWAILVFILISYYKLKGGFLNYAKGFLEPIPVMLPLNILGEIATPISMAFRHYGNVLSGSVIAILIASALQGLSSLITDWLPGIFADFPIFRIGIPAVLSLYFDIFSSVMQAYIFAMLTMMNISGGFPQDVYEARLQKKLARAKN